MATRSRLRPTRATGPSGLAAVAVAAALTLLVACSSDRHARSEALEPTPTYQSTTGIPVLMDLPLIGWLFRHTRTVR